jgi:hypothetical protein
MKSDCGMVGSRSSRLSRLMALVIKRIAKTKKKTTANPTNIKMA